MPPQPGQAHLDVSCSHAGQIAVERLGFILHFLNDPSTQSSFDFRLVNCLHHCLVYNILIAFTLKFNF